MHQPTMYFLLSYDMTDEVRGAGSERDSWHKPLGGYFRRNAGR